MIPTTTSIGETTWSQNEEDKAIEIRIPLSLPDGVRPRDLNVSIKDSVILCVSSTQDVLLQWRLHAAVADEVEWSVENNNTLIAGLEKKTASSWPALIDLPVPEEYFVPDEEINRLFGRLLPVLPKPKRIASIGANDLATAEGEGEGEGDGDDLDKLLDEAAEEVTGKKEDDEDDDSSPSALFIKSELENFKTEYEEITTKLAEVEVTLRDPTENEATKTAHKHKKVLETMLQLYHEVRAIRSEPSSLANFIKHTQLDLRKARVNIGEFNDTEVEEYANDEEKNLPPEQLFSKGVEALGDQDISSALHLLRLAAIHHKHDQSIITLFNIYSQLSSPRGALLLFQRALEDENPSGIVNHKVGELYDSGSRFFLPLFPAALYFQQRAARFGDTAALLSLAHLWLRGTTATSMLSEEDVESLRSVPKYHQWMQLAMDRGCGSAHVVQGLKYLKGEDGLPRSYKEAKKHLDIGGMSQPSLLRSLPQVTMALEALRREEEGGEDSKTVASPTTIRKQRAMAERQAAHADYDDGEVTEVSASVDRLNSLVGSGRGTVGLPASRTRKNFGGSARRKAFWERAAVVGASVYGIYTLAFPIRILLMPAFFAFLDKVVTALPWLGNDSFEF